MTVSELDTYAANESANVGTAMHGQYRSGGNPQMPRSANMSPVVVSQEQTHAVQGIMYGMGEPEDSHLPREPRINDCNDSSRTLDNVFSTALATGKAG